jgi:hypothetical protein
MIRFCSLALARAVVITSVTDVIRAIIIANKSQVDRYIFFPICTIIVRLGVGRMSTLKEYPSRLGKSNPTATATAVPMPIQHKLNGDYG